MRWILSLRPLYKRRVWDTKNVSNCQWSHSGQWISRYLNQSAWLQSCSFNNCAKLTWDCSISNLSINLSYFKSICGLELSLEVYLGQSSLRWFLILSPFCCKYSVTQSCLTLWPHGLLPTRLLCPPDFLGQNTRVGCHFLLQEMFLTQGPTHVSCTAGKFFTSEPLGLTFCCSLSNSATFSEFLDFFSTSDLPQAYPIMPFKHIPHFYYSFSAWTPICNLFNYSVILGACSERKSLVSPFFTSENTSISSRPCVCCPELFCHQWLSELVSSDWKTGPFKKQQCQWGCSLLKGVCMWKAFSDLSYLCKLEGDILLFFYTFMKNLAHSISTCPSFMKWINLGRLVLICMYYKNSMHHYEQS